MTPKTSLAALLAGAAIALAAPAAAQVVDVRSGEHASFTRLVFYLNETRDWTLGRTDTGWRLGLAGEPAQFAVEDVFDFIPRRRLEEISPEADGLSFQVSCDCHARAFEYRDDILVIDFRDGPPPADSAFEAPFASAPDEPVLPVTAEAPQAVALPPLTATPQLPDNASPPAVDAPAPAAALPLPSAVPLPGRPGPEALPGLFAAGDPVASAELRDELARSLSQAIAAGLATPVDPLEPIEGPADATGPLAALAGAGAPIDLRSALDPVPSPDEGGPQVDCLSPFHVAIGDWGGMRPPEDVVSDGRASFLEDLATPSDDAVLKRARSFVYLTFGAEAAQVLRAYPVPGDQSRVLSAMAMIMDDPDTPGPEWLAPQVACDGPIALWGLLATDPDRPIGTPNAGAVQRTLSEMPLHLRTHLGPAVSERLRALGDADAAAAARATITRAVDRPTEALIVETARAERELVAEAEGDPAAAPPPDGTRMRQLADAAGRNDAVALTAQAELLRRMAGAKRPVPRELRDEVAAQIHAAGGLPEALDLLDAYVGALARGGQYRTALDYLDRLERRGRTPEAALQRQVDQLLRELTDEASDGSFLLLTGSRTPAELPAAPTPPVSLLVSGRLADLGFPEAAAAYAAPVPDFGPPDPARQRQLAQQALADGNPNEALARLAGQNDEASLAISARALLDLGAPEEAGRIFERLGNDAAAARAYWQAGRWDRAAALSPDDQRRELAGLLAETAAEAPAPAIDLPVVSPEAADGTLPVLPRPQPQPPATEIRLSDADALIAESSSLRDLAEGILGAP